jgi:hypothetical protein
MKMKLFDFKVMSDYGKDYYFFFLKTKTYTALQMSFSTCEYPGWPHLQITFGSGRMFGMFAYAWKFGFDIDLFSRTWRWEE